MHKNTHMLFALVSEIGRTEIFVQADTPEIAEKELRGYFDKSPWLNLADVEIIEVAIDEKAKDWIARHAAVAAVDDAVVFYGHSEYNPMFPINHGDSTRTPTPTETYVDDPGVSVPSGELTKV